MVTRWMLLLACSDPGSSVAPVSKSVVQNSGQSVRVCLSAAAQLSGPPERARQAIHQCYKVYFEPLEASLRAQNPRATLSLEYGFGKLAAGVSSRTDPQEQSMGASMLADRVESVLATIPIAEPEPKPKNTDTGGTETTLKR